MVERIPLEGMIFVGSSPAWGAKMCVCLSSQRDGLQNRKAVSASLTMHSKYIPPIGVVSGLQNRDLLVRILPFVLNKC